MVAVERIDSATVIVTDPRFDQPSETPPATSLDRWTWLVPLLVVVLLAVLAMVMVKVHRDQLPFAGPDPA